MPVVVKAAVNGKNRSQRGSRQLAGYCGHRYHSEGEGRDTVVAGLRSKRRAVVEVEHIAQFYALALRCWRTEWQRESRHDAAAVTADVCPSVTHVVRRRTPIQQRLRVLDKCRRPPG